LPASSGTEGNETRGQNAWCSSSNGFSSLASMLVVLPFARVLENERITARSLAGGAMAVAGVVG